MTEQLFIDGKPYSADRFAFDGCHKLYLLHPGEDLSEYGWDESQYHPISELADAWEDSCFLRFISWGDLSTVISQCHEDEVVIEVRESTPAATPVTPVKTSDGTLISHIAFNGGSQEFHRIAKDGFVLVNRNGVVRVTGRWSNADIAAVVEAVRWADLRQDVTA